MPKLNIIATGSSGNCYSIEMNDEIILVDCGVPLKRIKETVDFAEYQKKPVTLYITHEHTDHISGLTPVINQLRPKIYTSEGTADSLHAKGVDTELLFVLDDSVQYDFKNYAVSPFRIMHDSAEPFGFSFNIEGKQICFATDLGVASDSVLNHLTKANTLILESNYEENLLLKGSYPEYLKKRIMSAKGHLSNKDALNVVGILSKDIIEKVFFAHISDENNDYDILNKYVSFCTEKYCVDTAFVRKGESLTSIEV